MSWDNNALLSILDTAKVMICRFRLDTTLTFVNDTYCRNVNVPRDRLIGRKFLDLVPEDDQKCIREHLHSLKDGGESYTCTHKVLTDDGSTKWQEWTDYIVSDRNDSEILFQSVGYDVTDRVEAELALKKERQRLSYILDGTNAGAWEWNIPSDKVYFNERYADILGYDTEELNLETYKSWQSFLHPEDLNYTESVITALIQGELDYFELETRMKHKSGSWIWVQIHCKVLERDDRGKATLMAGIHQEITSRKSSQLLLLESERRYRNLFESQNNLIVRLDRNHSITYVNRKFCDVFGFVPGDILKSNNTHILENTIFQTRQPGGVNTSSELISKLENPPYRLKFEQKAGITEKQIWFTWDFSAIKDESGQIVEFQGVGTNISNLKKTEKELRKSRRVFRQMAESLEDVLLLISADFKDILYVNSSFEDVWNLSREDLYNNPDLIRNSIHPDDKLIYEQAREEYHTSLILDTDLRIVRNDGKIRWLNIRYHPVYDDEGVIIRHTGIIRDYTGEKNIINLVRKNIWEKESIISGVHERLKKSLSIIENIINLQLVTLPDDQNTVSILSKVSSRVAVIALVHDIMHKNKQMPDTNIDELTDSLVGAYQGKYDNVSLVYEQRPKNLFLDTNKSLMLALMLNELLLNATEHAFPESQAGSVEIRIEEEAAGFRLIVQDNGTGVSHAEMIHRPEHFGMTLVHGISRELNASITFETEEAGLKVTTWIPAQKKSYVAASVRNSAS